MVTYYGDDFTGSTDVMEALSLGGVPTVLFLDAPTPEQVQNEFGWAKAVGIAGTSRAMSPDEMTAELTPAFQALERLGAPLVHYKICSTFDSSPTVGSIGHAAEIGWQVFNPPVIPLVVGAPRLKRYLVFGNLFATIGDTTHRLDRHPVMQQHPITPMGEADLRLHLAEQTDMPIGSIDVLQLEGQSQAALRSTFDDLVADGKRIVMLDTINDAHLQQVGGLIWSRTGGKPVFVVGSSGLEYALALHWQAEGMVAEPEPFPDAGEAGQLLVMSGSAAQFTNTQIQYALDRGYAAMALNTPRLADPATEADEREHTVKQALHHLSTGKNLVIYATRGTDDPIIEQTRQQLASAGLDPATAGNRVAQQQGIILRELVERTDLKRVCVAGGDTSGFAAKQLGIYALEMVMPIAPGGPLCRARSSKPRFEGLEISLKGGQVGKDNYFHLIQRGSTKL